MPAAREDLYDIVVVGGGPAGGAAALRAGQQKARVLLLEQEKKPRPRACAGWIGPAGMQLCKLCGLDAKRLGAAPFEGLRLWSWDLRRNTEVRDAGLRGWLIGRPAFDQALLERAATAGVDIRFGAPVHGLELGEQHAILQFGRGGRAAGKVVLIADGLQSPTARLARMSSAWQEPNLPSCMYAEGPVGKGPPGLHVAIGASRAGQIATIVRLPNRVRLYLATRDHAAPVEQQFQMFREAACAAGLLPNAKLASPLRCRSPAGAALDLDTHVGKRCLLVGDAGGFVAAFSHEGLYPAMKSGWLAAETAVRALQAPLLQDALATFGGAWRGELADYLRMPNTDLALLTPLLFNNARMARRVARAFLLGRAF